MNIHIVFLFNGIGNQLSQYALYKQLKEKSNNVYLLNNCVDIPGCSGGLDIKKLSPKIVDSLLNPLCAKILVFFIKAMGQNRIFFLKHLANYLARLLSIRVVNEKNFFEKKGSLNLYIDGWLNKVVEDPSDIYNDVFAEFFAKHCMINRKHIHDESCAIHFRGGDYIDGGKDSQIYGGIADIGYYRRAIQKLSESKKISLYVIFTNDVQAATIIFEELGINFVFSSEIGSKTFLEDLCSMSYFPNLIMSNSSFSYWSAATFSLEKVVLCPTKYRHYDDIDIYLENWTQV